MHLTPFPGHIPSPALWEPHADLKEDPIALIPLIATFGQAPMHCSAVLIFSPCSANPCKQQPGLIQHRTPFRCCHTSQPAGQGLGSFLKPAEMKPHRSSPQHGMCLPLLPSSTGQGLQAARSPAVLQGQHPAMHRAALSTSLLAVLRDLYYRRQESSRKRWEFLHPAPTPAPKRHRTQQQAQRTDEPLANLHLSPHLQIP